MRCKMKICFVRHGDNANDKLTRLGRLQAKLVCNDLAYENITKIYCSPKQRTIDTAKIIGKKLKISDIEVCDSITERQKLRQLDVQNDNDIKYNENYLNCKYSSHNPEGCKEFCDRIFGFLDKVIDMHFPNNENILIVGHSSMAYVLNAYFTGVPKDNNLVWVRLGNCSKICYEVLPKQ